MFKLSLRELFLLVTLAAVLVGWRLDRRSLIMSKTEAQTKQATAEAKQAEAEAATIRGVDRYARVYSAVRQRGMYVDIGPGKYPNVAIRGNSLPDVK